MKSKRLYIDMCAGSELMDTQGETLSIEGANIDDLKRLNDNHGKGFFNSLGIVTEAKKIFKAEDCENERHRYYWDKIKAPYIYAAGYLHNDEDHPNARAAAAILRNIHRDDVPLKLKASVEGGVLARGIKDPTRLARTKIHSVALTFTPANNATLVEPLNIDKSSSDWEADKQLIKSVMHLAETNVPSFRHIERHASANTIYENINKIQELAKSVGIDIMIKDVDPDTIMQKAVLNKISANVSKITHLVKAVKDLSTDTAMYTSPGKVQMAAQDKAAQKIAASDKHQQGLKRLKSDPTTPAKPKDLTQTSYNTMKVKSGKQFKDTNTLKMHASRAMKDPAYLDTVKNTLVQRGIPNSRIDKILSHVKMHMQEPVQKSSDEVQKGDLGRAAKNILVAGAMGLAVDSMSPKDDNKSKDTKPKAERSVASEKTKKPKSKRFGDDEYMNSLDDKARARAEKVKDKYKNKLKKALMAGYGGAGTPTDLTGGGVFQAESLDSGRTQKADDGEFKYINCDNCGHEQVYMNHQVKCRKCHQNFNLSKLEDLI